MKYGIELLDFSDIMIELIKHLSVPKNVKRGYDIEILQTLRMVLINIIQIKDNKIELQGNLVKYLNIDENSMRIKFKNNRVNKKIIISG